MRINLFGGPGTGKSVLAAWIFTKLKEQHLNVELITEYIKSWAWKKLSVKSWDQFYVFAKQLHAEDEILRHGYTHIVTDSPIALAIPYMRRDNCHFTQQCKQLVHKFENEFPSVNILLQRIVPYSQEGRYQTLEEAKAMDKLIAETIDDVYSNVPRMHPIDDKEKMLDLILRKIKLPIKRKCLVQQGLTQTIKEIPEEEAIPKTVVKLDDGTWQVVSIIKANNEQ